MPRSEALSLSETVDRLTEWVASVPPDRRMIHPGSAPKAFLVVPSGDGGLAVLREVHRRVSRSVLVDLTGRTAEDAVRQLRSVTSERDGDVWTVLLANTHRAGSARSSVEETRVVRDLLLHLNSERVPALVHVRGRAQLSRNAQDVYWLDAADRRAPAEFPLTPEICSLALAEERAVPWGVWRELVRAYTGAEATEQRLTEIVAEWPGRLTEGPNGVSFADELDAERARDHADSATARSVNRSLFAWLWGRRGEWRHPAGWAASGPVGRYAARALAMHAALAGDSPLEEAGAGCFELLIADGATVAHIPQLTLLDAAAVAGYKGGDSAVGYAAHLLDRDLLIETQAHWASWLHLMSVARGDEAYAGAVLNSGIDLPWQCAWARWRPPGALHPDFLDVPPAFELTEVFWNGTHAVASLWEDGTLDSVWTVSGGECLWRRSDSTLEEALDSLALRDEDTGAAGRPVHELRDVYEAVASGPHFYPSLVATPSIVADRTVVLGSGPEGLFAITTSPLDDLDVLSRSASEPVGGYFEPTEITPAGSQPPTLTDVPAMLGVSACVPIPTTRVPADLRHEPTRELLTGFGVPRIDVAGLVLDPDDKRFLQPYQQRREPQPSGDAVFCWLGEFAERSVLVHGATGAVYLVPLTGGDGELLAQSVESFLVMAGMVLTAALTAAGLEYMGAYADPLLANLEAALRRIDPAGGQAPAWTDLLDLLNEAR
ncbi:SUKH-4 family immunity protein [Streptomyces alkaliterrae]|uniref:SUKH-4 family immunity protein n=1 Tax=Streptomyces alkaliterrae TaxID=2213162 RepID=A0A5P0YPE6_9ACTN|nr:SUKH-4 family immunity protein [Streptomyces alkaliterrae]MBB1261037.1 SUKH-4 family immunity protein [Streptomyces alkaliterrae]MQS02196.1 hypothetical protein [Streptomyces alkaliterrae]